MKVFKNPITGETFEDISVAKRAYCTTHPCTLGGCKFYEDTNGGLCSKWAAAHPEEAAELMGLVVEEAEAEPVDKPFTGEIPGEVCSDNRFELIEKYKTKLINGTNIGSVKEEMAVIDNILFRFWQMGWLDTLEKAYAQTMNTKNVGEKTGDSPARPRLAEVLGVVEDEEWNFPGLIRTCRIHNGVRECFIAGEWKLCDNEGILTHIINHPESIIHVPHLTEPEIAIMRAMGAKWVSLDANLIDESVMLWSDKPDKDGDGNFTSPTSALAAVAEELFPSVKPGDCIGLEEAE